MDPLDMTGTILEGTITANNVQAKRFGGLVRGRAKERRRSRGTDQHQPML
jgi:hypothetical protein